MPGRDGTGPLGLGAMSGRGRGFCSRVNMVCRGAGLGLGLWAAKRGLGGRAVRRGAGIGLGLCRGLGSGFRSRLAADPMNDVNSSKIQRELLEDEKAHLENRLRILNQQLKDFSEVVD